MKGKLLVVFNSKHGYTKRYVDIIGNEFGCDAVPLDKLKGDMLAPYDKILFIASVRDGVINGIKKIADYFDAIYKKLTICGVGMLPFRSDIPRRLKDTSISVTYEKFLPVFYVQGGFDVDEIGRMEKMAIAMKLRQIKLSELISDEDTFFMNAMNAPVDEVKKENIKPLLDHLDGKEVEQKWYSPPEITDPEEEKKFFEELDAATKEPENKQKALKKKLLK